MSDLESSHKPEPSNNDESMNALFDDESTSASEQSTLENKTDSKNLKIEQEKKLGNTLEKVESLHGKNITDAKEREKVKNELGELGKDIDNLDNDAISKSANEHKINTTYDALASGKTETSIAHDKIDVNFEKADTTLTLFSTLDEHLPHWEKVIGGSGDITENNARGRVVREFATELIKATGETSIRPDNAYIFTRACEALSILTNHYNVPLKADLFHDDGKCNIKAIKAFAQANKEILTDPNIELSDGTNILDIEDSLALIDIEKRIEES